jgi:hypothetical protein
MKKTIITTVFAEYQLLAISTIYAQVQVTSKKF